MTGGLCLYRYNRNLWRRTVPQEGMVKWQAQSSEEKGTQPANAECAGSPGNSRYTL
jgi:hypothetical protein